MLQKIIPFQEVTCVKRAKTAGIFPNAIEIFAGAKKVVVDLNIFPSFILFVGTCFNECGINLFILLVNCSISCSILLFFQFGSISLRLSYLVMKLSSSLMMGGCNIVMGSKQFQNSRCFIHFTAYLWR